MTTNTNSISTQTVINWTKGLQKELRGTTGLTGAKTNINRVQTNALNGKVDANVIPCLLGQIETIKKANVLSAKALENVKLIDRQIRDTIPTPAPLTQKPTPRTVTQQPPKNAEKTNSIVKNSHQQFAQDEILRAKARREEQERKLKIGKQLYEDSVSKHGANTASSNTNAFVPVTSINGKIVASDSTKKTQPSVQIKKPKKKKVRFSPSTKPENSEVSPPTPKPVKKEKGLLSTFFSAIFRFFASLFG